MSGREAKRGGSKSHKCLRSAVCTALLGAVVLFALPMRADAQPPHATIDRAAGVGIDHLILGINDLDRGMADFARMTGVTPVKGGVHPGRGTQNALASLSDGRYIEILAPSHEAGTVSAAETAFPTLTPVGWALHTSDLAEVVTGMRAAGFKMSEIRPGSRARPDGVMLSWQTANVSGAGLDAAPFFISWGRGTPHPSTQSPTGCRFTSVALVAMDPSPLAKFLQIAGVEVSITKGTVEHMTVVLACPKGSVTFR